MTDVNPAAQPARPQSAIFDADLDVLAFTGLRLLDDSRQPRRPRFGDDRWDLSAIADIPAYARQPSLLIVDWTTVADQAWRLCAKELGLALLQPQVGLEHRLAGARRSRLPPHELAHQLTFWRRWFDWLERHGVHRLSEVTQVHCDAWLAGRRAQIDPTALRGEVANIRRFADYRPILTADSYREGFRPWAAKSAAKVAGLKPRGENVTPVIADDVFGPLLAAALFLVQVAGPDVVAARAEWRRLKAQARLGGSIEDRLAQHLADLERSGAPLPELHPVHLIHQRGRGLGDDPLHKVNISMIERSIAAPKGSLTRTARCRAMLEGAVAALGCSGFGLTTPVNMVADPADAGHRRPWREPFSPLELEHLAELVGTGCYVVVAALSGMRHSELAEMRRGCVHGEQLANGRLRYRIHAKLIKGKPFGGQDERWTVIEEVAQAFAVIEALTDSEQPFARFHPPSRYRRLLRWANGPGAQAFLAPIPPCAVSGRQFRRTLARLLGFRPNGVIAGKIHLKHISVVTSEGYYGRVGSSAAAFLAEVEHETARARIETTRRLYADWAAGTPVAGPGRAELTRMFHQVHADMAAFDGSVVDSDRRLEDLLRRRANTLHVGPLNNCWFVDPSRAQCLKQVGRTTAAAPLIGMCEPTRCANSTQHPEHVPVWISTSRHLEKLQASPRVPKQEKERLAAEKTRVDAVIRAVNGAGEGR